MAILASILLLGSALQNSVPAPETFTLFGDTITVEAPHYRAADFPDDVKSWKGWGNLGGQPAAIATPFTTDGNWSATVAKALALASDPAPVQFRVRVFLIPAVDLLFRTASGN